MVFGRSAIGEVAGLSAVNSLVGPEMGSSKGPLSRSEHLVVAMTTVGLMGRSQVAIVQRPLLLAARVPAETEIAVIMRVGRPLETITSRSNINGPAAAKDHRVPYGKAFRRNGRSSCAIRLVKVATAFRRASSQGVGHY